MASVIDTFLFQLGLDTRDYQKGQKEAEDSLQKFGDKQDKQTKEITAQAKVMAEGFRHVRNELLSLVAVAFGAKSVKDFFANMVTGQAALGRVAKNLGESAREIDAWGAAVETVGGTAAGFQSSMQAMQAGFEAFKLGENSPVVQAFHALGIDVADANGKIRPMRDLLLDLSAALKKLAPQDQIRVAQMLGMDEGTLNLLRQGREEVTGTVDQMYRASGVTEESTAAAAKAQAQWAQFKRELYGVGQVIFQSLTPALEGSNKQLLGISSWVQEHKEGIGAFFGALAATIGAVTKGLSELFGWLWKLGEKISGTSFGNKLGEWMAKFFAYGGSKEAADALAANGAAGGGGTAPAAPGKAAGGSLFDTLENKFGIPAGTLDKIWSIESARGKNMVSAAGATGHFQFMPATAAQFGLSREDTFDLSKSATAAAQYISQLLKKYGGDMQMALSAYNWGPGNLDRKGLAGAPSETQNYWKRFQQLGTGGGRGNTTTVQTNIQSVTINTKATDAAGIARDLNAELQTQGMLGAATLGLQ